MKEACTEVERILRYEFLEAILHFIGRDVPVYLDGFGLLSPEIHTETKAERSGTKTTLRSETFRTVIFEKCYDLISFHRERVAEVAELKELIQWIYPRLPLFITAETDERSLRTFLKGKIQHIKESVVNTGHDSTLSGLGEFFSLHNRQGSSFSEWYAGADIFLKAKYKRAISQRTLGTCEQPVLASAWEPLEATFGAPATCFRVDLIKELNLLGYDPTHFPAGESTDIKVAAFRVPRSPTSEPSILFCSDGLRKLGLSSPATRGLGNEIVFQLPLESAEPPLEEFIGLAQRPYTLAWMLIQSAPSKTTRHGAGLACEAPLFVYGEKSRAQISSSRSPIHMVLATYFDKIRLRQLSNEGPFSYLSIIGITEDEGALATTRSAEHLITLLSRRKLLQVTRPFRPSILLRTEILDKGDKKTRKLGHQEPHSNSDERANHNHATVG